MCADIAPCVRLAFAAQGFLRAIAPDSWAGPWSEILYQVIHCPISVTPIKCGMDDRRGAGNGSPLHAGLEHQPKGKLDQTGLIHLFADNANIDCPSVVPGALNCTRLQDIEELGFELECDLFGDRGALAHGQVEVVDAVSAQLGIRPQQLTLRDFGTIIKDRKDKLPFGLWFRPWQCSLPFLIGGNSSTSGLMPCCQSSLHLDRIAGYGFWARLHLGASFSFLITYSCSCVCVGATPDPRRVFLPDHHQVGQDPDHEEEPDGLHRRLVIS